MTKEPHLRLVAKLPPPPPALLSLREEGISLATESFEEAVTAIFQDLVARNLTLEDVGSSREELEELRKRYHRLQAESLLRGAHSDEKTIRFHSNAKHLFAQTVGALKAHLYLGGLAPEDVGTTEDEISVFVRQLK